MTALTPSTRNSTRRTSARRLSPGAWLMVKMIRGYQHLMAWSPPRCRFAGAIYFW